MNAVTVNYLNTLPYIHGLKDTDLNIVTTYPAKCIELLHNGQADIALVPVGGLQEDREYYLINDYGIGANGAVRTVALFGDRPMEEWTEVVLDYQSRTSVLLTQLLLNQYWKRKVHFIQGQQSYEESLIGSRGGLIIGDRAFEYEKKYAYNYDLAEAWKNWKGLPFIFAVWVSLKQIPKEQRDFFSKSLESGLQNFQYSPSLTKLNVDIKSYYEENISYRLTDEYWKSFEIFNSLLGRKMLKIKRI